MLWMDCKTCGVMVEVDSLDAKCPTCGSSLQKLRGSNRVKNPLSTVYVPPTPEPPLPPDSQPEMGPMVSPDKQNSNAVKTETRSLKSQSLADTASEQAAILGKFGVALQVLGYGCIAIFAVCAMIFAADSEWTFFGYFMGLILVTFVTYNVGGSVFRAIGAYIQFKVQ
jgi:hypothetical protein